jgi:hypothetical protein
VLNLNGSDFTSASRSRWEKKPQPHFIVMALLLRYDMVDE